VTSVYGKGSKFFFTLENKIKTQDEKEEVATIQVP